MFQVKALAGRVPSSASVRVAAESDHVAGAEGGAIGRRVIVALGGIADADGQRRRERVFTPSETVSRTVYWPGFV